jgi:hypothetical protein
MGSVVAHQAMWLPQSPRAGITSSTVDGRAKSWSAAILAAVAGAFLYHGGFLDALGGDAAAINGMISA